MKKFEQYLQVRKTLIEINYEKFKESKECDKKKKYLKRIQRRFEDVRKVVDSYNTLYLDGLISEKTFLKTNEMYDTFVDEINNIMFFVRQEFKAL